MTKLSGWCWRSSIRGLTQPKNAWWVPETLRPRPALIADEVKTCTGRPRLEVVVFDHFWGICKGMCGAKLSSPMPELTAWDQAYVQFLWQGQDLLGTTIYQWTANWFHPTMCVLITQYLDQIWRYTRFDGMTGSCMLKGMLWQDIARDIDYNDHGLLLLSVLLSVLSFCWESPSSG